YVFAMNSSKRTIGVVMLALVAALSEMAEARHGRQEHEHNFMQEFMDELGHTPVLLYQCYRNGTTIEPENSRNLTIFFDGEGKRNGIVLAYLWYADKDTNHVSRDTALLNFHIHSPTHTVTFDATGTTSEVSLVAFREFKAHYITEVVRGREPVGKIYDVDLKCTNAQELYKEGTVDEKKKEKKKMQYAVLDDQD
ncbi:hypothetical protein HPB47_002241, partial [Ixodes persulcatus]